MRPVTIDLSDGRKPRPDPKLKWGTFPASPTVIAFDPGGTTGWSLITVHPESLVNPAVGVLDNMERFQHGQVDCGANKGDWGTSGYSGISISGEAAGVNDCVQLCRAWPGAAVVIESFNLRQFRKDQDLLSPVRITAALSQSLWNSNRGFFAQAPGDAMHSCTDDRLKLWGVYQREGGLGHARDADRHALFFLRRAKEHESLRRQAWPYLYDYGQPYGLGEPPEIKVREPKPETRLKGIKI